MLISRLEIKYKWAIFCSDIFQDRNKNPQNFDCYDFGNSHENYVKLQNLNTTARFNNRRWFTPGVSNLLANMGHLEKKRLRAGRTLKKKLIDALIVNTIQFLCMKYIFFSI